MGSKKRKKLTEEERLQAARFDPRQISIFGTEHTAELMSKTPLSMEPFCLCCMQYVKFVDEHGKCPLCAAHCPKERCQFRVLPGDYEEEGKH
jgi:hypothetical protein